MGNGEQTVPISTTHRRSTLGYAIITRSLQKVITSINPVLAHLGLVQPTVFNGANTCQ